MSAFDPLQRLERRFVDAIKGPTSQFPNDTNTSVQPVKHPLGTRGA